MKITFYFVRHGETMFNQKSRIQGRCDSMLSERGRAQVKKAASALQRVYFDKAFTSPAERCLDTAQIILEGRNMKPEIIEDLHEGSFGRLEGSRFTSHPDEMRACFDSRDFSSVGGESSQDMGRRVYKVMDTIVSKCEDGDHALITSHGYLESYFMEILLGVDIAEYAKAAEGEFKNMTPNAGIMVFTYEDGRYSIVNLPMEASEWVPAKEEKTIHFYYVRHGETVFNVWNRMQGSCDSPLTEKGIYQAHQTADALRNISFSQIFTSSSERARNTAAIIAAGRNIVPVAMRGLKEVDFGDFEAVVRDSWIDEINRRHETEDWQDVGGESGQQVRTRILRTLSKIISRTKDGSNVLLVSHGTYYMNILKNLFDIDGQELKDKLRKEGKQPMPNGGVFRFDYVNGDFKLVQLMVAPEEFKI
jgi:broad specificity phosphatase PhoE